MKRLPKLAVLFLATFPVLAGVLQAEAPDVISVTGEIGYRERIALRPGSMVTVTLSDVSRQDVPAAVVVEASFPITTVPAPFELKTAANLKSGHSYALRTTIRDGAGTLRWTTDTVQRIDPEQAVTDLGLLLLVQVPATPTSDLTGGEWLVEDINNRGVMDYAQTTLAFDAEGNVYGSGGCNRFKGSYDLSGDRLSFGPIATTQMACTEALNNQERAFFDVLASPLRVTFDDTGALVLTGEDGKSLTARRK